MYLLKFDTHFVLQFIDDFLVLSFSNFTFRVISQFYPHTSTSPFNFNNRSTKNSSLMMFWVCWILVLDGLNAKLFMELCQTIFVVFQFKHCPIFNFFYKDVTFKQFYFYFNLACLCKLHSTACKRQDFIKKKIKYFHEWNFHKGLGGTNLNSNSPLI